ncbi:exosortase N [Dyadobacter crusticola]|uniref:exosortase N n=1 Tax=Dyadobacter crusticola TaxID=292407 RepID=UPI0004E0C367|nr:exosortase N [Dyadobacter crusticola]
MLAGKRYTGLFFLVGYTMLFGSLFASGYLKADATSLIGAGLIPFVLQNNGTRGSGTFFGLLASALIVACFFRNEQTFRYLLLVSAALFAVQHFYGKFILLPAALLVIISPLFKYVSEVFTFPIRLQLSEWSAIILRAGNIPVTVSGNIIEMNGAGFSVDPACMGLQMTGFSLLAGIFLIVHEQRRTQQALKPILQLAILLAAFLLNILSNLIRIVMLVAFHISPENPLHDWAGIICLLVYVWLPLSFLVKYLHSSRGTALCRDKWAQWEPGGRSILVHFAVLACCVYFVSHRNPSDQANAKTVSVSIPGAYKTDVMKNGVIQCKSEQALIYIKPIPEFFTTEHNPAICWTGSGYELTSIREKHFAGKTVYVGTLKKGSDQLQTAWWFSNQHYTTISQLDWRWKAMRGEGDFQLIYVTAGSEHDLNLAVRTWLKSI